MRTFSDMVKLQWRMSLNFCLALFTVQHKLHRYLLGLAEVAERRNASLVSQGYDDGNDQTIQIRTQDKFFLFARSPAMQFPGYLVRPPSAISV